MDRGPMLVVPPSEIKNLYSLPDNRLDQSNTTYDSLQINYTVQDLAIIHNDFHLDVVRNQLTRNLDSLTEVMVTEIDNGFRRTFGTCTTTWKELPVWHTCMTLVAGAANGALCGAPLCRDEDFLGAMRDHATCVFGGAIVINAVPEILRPILGTGVKLACSYYYKKALKKCLPIVRDRVELTSRVMSGQASKVELPEDGLQWLIYEAFKKPNPDERDPVRLAERLLFLNDVSMHTTSYSVSNVIVNLFSSDPSLGYVETLREECRRVLAQNNGVWTRKAVQQLRLMDSAIRESLRVSSFSSVYDPEGLSIAHGSSRVTIPRGTIIALPMDDVHKDESIYHDAHSYQPWRFVVPEEGESTPVNRKYVGKQTVTLDENFLGFGCGKHACPGRFFAVHEMKLVLAHLLLNYEVERIPTRPVSSDFIWMKLYTYNFKIKVRRIA
ncbi:hypothetical protein G7054_g8381 [Neopestalotiopsis clavispora]|nr:hypothetical protein G7054_g8381 [Neopestalotiopsis clavispora]